ncbi:MAG: glycosyltransferase [Polaromonas sp.]|jgi:N-acetylglucosaminyldiphosphoundecaprenol N-acetyl-beta-D-mannosaminyltransferase|nr:glycosyltransferase [Polaromonas sp.]
MLIRKIQRLHTLDDRQELLQRLSHPDRPHILAFVNAHAMNLLTNSEPFFDSLCASDTVLRDGSGMETLYNQLHIPPGFNLNGTDLIPEVLGHFNGRCIAFFGTQNPYLENGVEFAEKNFVPQSKCVRADGFLDENAYISIAAECRPALIVLGMGMPRQEMVANALRASLAYPCLIICGGAIIDFWGGKTSRAPLWMRRSGMEWLFRLKMEPRRLFQRYVTGNLVFLARTLVFPIFSRRFGRQVFKRQV